MLTARSPRSVEAVSEQSNPVVLFLINCGNENLQYLLVPARLDAAMAAIDTDSDGETTAIEWRVSESEILGRLRRGGGVLVAEKYAVAFAAHRSITTQGGGHRGRAPGQARRAGRAARQVLGRGAQGDRRVHGRVPVRRPRGV